MCGWQSMAGSCIRSLDKSNCKCRTPVRMCANRLVWDFVTHMLLKYRQFSVSQEHTVSSGTLVRVIGDDRPSKRCVPHCWVRCCELAIYVRVVLGSLGRELEDVRERVILDGDTCAA